MRKFSILIPLLFLILTFVLLAIPSQVLAADPEGWLDVADCSVFAGWTCDGDNWNQSINVQFYANNPPGAGGTLVGTATANGDRPDLVSAGACGSTANHGFNFTTPASLKDGASHSIYAYGVNIGAGSNTQLQMIPNPKTITCSAAPSQVAWWKFDEGSGTTANDSSGNGNTATVNGGATWTAGKISSALNFDGADDYASVTNSASLQVGGAFTIAAWVYPLNSSGRYGIFSTRKTNASGSWQLEVGTANGGTNRVAVTGVGTWIKETADNAIGTGDWYHIAYTRSSNSDTGTIYVNGAPAAIIGSNAYTISDNGDDKEIGRGTSGAQRFPGRIDDVRLYNYALTAAEISAIYSAPPPTPTPTPTPTPSPSPSPSPSPPSPSSTCGSSLFWRAKGLVSAPSLTGKFYINSLDAACAVSSKTVFSTVGILEDPFENLKAFYYTQARDNPVLLINKNPPITGPATQTNIPMGSTEDQLYYINGDLNLTLEPTGTKTGIVFVEGNLTIGPLSTGTQFNWGDSSSGMVFIVKGNVIIDKTMTLVDAVIISSGTIYTAGSGCSTSTVTASQLVVNGSLISLGSNQIKFCRTLGVDDLTLPAEKINHQAKYLVILRDIFAGPIQDWSEIP